MFVATITNISMPGTLLSTTDNSMMTVCKSAIITKKFIFDHLKFLNACIKIINKMIK